MTETQAIRLRTWVLLLVILNLAIISMLAFIIYTVLGVANSLKVIPVPQEEVLELKAIVESPKVVPAVVVPVKKQLSEREKIDVYIRDISKQYKLDPGLISSIIYHESRFNPKARTGNCLGLMQVSTTWHKKRADKLNVEDFYDPYGNILLGTDYISELIDQYKDPALALMMYNMKHDDALAMWKRGKISSYAKSVLAKAKQY